MAITLAKAEAILDAWVAASEAAAKGQSYSMNGRSLTLANIGEINEQIQIWERRVASLKSSTKRTGLNVALADFSE